MSPIYHRRSGLVWRWFRATVILLDGGDRTQNLQGSAALVWELLSEPRTVAEIIDAANDLGIASGVPPSDLDRLVHEAVEVLLGSQLIVQAHASASAEQS